mgnify:CR=1 FL=1
MTSVFITEQEGPFTLDSRESDEGIWMDYKEIMQIPEKKFTPDFYATLVKIKEFL